MQKMKNVLRRGALYALTLVLVGGYPTAAFAEDAPSDPQPDPETYTYNDQTGHWDTSKWRYDPISGTYVPVTPPPAPVEETSPAPDTSGTAQAASLDGGPGSTNDITTVSDGTSTTTITNGNSIKNGLGSDATTGDAGVIKNTKAGGATTGDASVDATTFNVIHSTVQGDAAGVAHFTADINGDVTGDIMLSPAINQATTGAFQTGTSNLSSTTNNQITNDLNLGAKSGNALVGENTEAGGATSGNANAVANVVNLINTIIAANQSFVGTINIYGNLNGDILISPDFIPQLIASNASSASDPSSLVVNDKDTQAIVNNINLNATTGNATVDGNTNAGDAKTGTAGTNLTILNLTGHKVTAENSLLVFINVLGSWVGVIVDAPAGATSAALGNGVTSDTTVIPAGTLSSTNNDKIINNLTVSAASGDATVRGNTNAGGATTGNATASANILNMTSSSFSLSKWFGILYINVFGTWHGSFGVNTANGDIVPLVTPTTTEPNTPPGFRVNFTPSTVANFASLVNADQGGDSTPVSDSQMAVLAATSNKAEPVMVSQPHENPMTDPFMIVLMGAGLAITIAGIGIEVIARRRSASVA